MPINGTPGDDNYTGTSGPDVYDMSQGGNDSVSGLGGADVFKFGGTFATGDFVDGGTGKDKLVLDGDYSVLVSFDPSKLVGVEHINLAAGHNYNFRFFDGVIDHGKTLKIHGGSLAGVDALNVDGSFMTPTSSDTKLVVISGGGSCTFTAGAGANVLKGGAGSDTVTMGDNFDAQDKLNGGASFNAMYLSGDYSAGLTLTASMMRNFDTLEVVDGNSYSLTMNDGNVAAGEMLTVYGGSLGSGFSLDFDGSAESNGGFTIYDGNGDDSFTGGTHFDLFLGTGGDDTVHTGAGGDTINMGNSLTGDDRIDGGSGSDELDLVGDYSAGVDMQANTMKDIETLFFNASSSYTVTMADGNVAAGEHLDISGGLLDAGDTLILDGSAETNGTYNIAGGAGNDTIIGGQAGNIISGGYGQDTLTAGAGADIFAFYYDDPTESTGAARDTINGFDAADDSFDLMDTVAGVDTAITTGTLREAHFDDDLAAAVDAAHLAEGDAVLFTPDAGGLKNHTFLIVDMFGGAGYQAGSDLVIQLEAATHLGSFGAGNFS